MAKKQQFTYNWISNLLKSMDSHLDESTKIKVLEECGRSCAKNNIKKEALKFKGELDSWLSKMKQWVGKDNIQKEENCVRVIYSKCLCMMVKDNSPILSGTYCNCSRGWLLEIFETVLEKPVEVRLQDSIMNGGKECRFTISF